MTNPNVTDQTPSVFRQLWILSGSRQVMLAVSIFVLGTASLDLVRGVPDRYAHQHLDLLLVGFALFANTVGKMEVPKAAATLLKIAAAGSITVFFAMNILS